ncbi:MAG: hypothetical protein U0840_26640 [Gemmataceae bacterium]
MQEQTWGSGTLGVTVVSASNSLVGSTTNDIVGYGGCDGAERNGKLRGAQSLLEQRSSDGCGRGVTWGWQQWRTGAVSASNSLVGSTTNDQACRLDGVTVLSNGNYVVRILSWDNGAATNAGAVTWGWQQWRDGCSECQQQPGRIHDE